MQHVSTLLKLLVIIQLASCSSFRYHGKGRLINNAIKLFSISWGIKRYPTDFIVLEDKALSKLYAYNAEVDNNTKSELTPTAAYGLFQELLSPQQIQELDIIAANTSIEDFKSKSVELRFSDELTKVQRTLLHQSIKVLHPQLESRTSQDPSQSCSLILVFRKGTKSVADVDTNRDNSNRATKPVEVNKKPVRHKQRKKVITQRWNRDNPNYHHFNVIKIGLTNAEMMDRLGRFSHLLPSRFGYCGSKDRQAVTLQRVSVWRSSYQTISDVNRKSMGSRTSSTKNKSSVEALSADSSKSCQLLVRDIEPASEPLLLGNLAGNHFIVSLRASNSSSAFNVKDIIKASEDDLVARIEKVSTVPFLNLFGTQRFGEVLAINPLIGRRLLASDYRGAIFALLLAPISNLELTLGNMSLEELEGWIVMDPTLSRQEYFERLRSNWRVYIQRIQTSAILEAYLNTTSEENYLTNSSVAPYLSNDAKVKRQMTNIKKRLQFLTEFVETGNLDSQEQRSFKHLGFTQQLLLTEIKKQLTKKTKDRNDSKSIGSFRNNDYAGVEGFLVKDIDFMAVFSVLPPSLKALFVNSYQSQLFNEAACVRMSAIGDPQGIMNREMTSTSASAVAGDLVLCDEENNPVTIWDLEELGNPILNADQVHSCSSSCDADSNRVKLCVREVTDADLELRPDGYPLESVVIPLPGYASRNPRQMEETVKKDQTGILLSGDHRDKLCRLPGAYRHVLASARNTRMLVSRVSEKIMDGETSKYSEWRKVGQSSSHSAASHTNVGSLDSLVESLWENATIPYLVDTIWNCSRRSTLTPPNYVKPSFAEDSSAALLTNLTDAVPNYRKQCKLNEQLKQADVEDKVSLSFSLCASSYATTYIESLLKF